MWLGTLSLKQVELLEGVFAVFTEEGWIIPPWVNSLRKKVELVEFENRCRRMAKTCGYWPTARHLAKHGYTLEDARRILFSSS